MNILQLPQEIMYIVITEMLVDALPLQTVNKEMKELSKKKLKENYYKYLRKQDFYKRCDLTQGEIALYSSLYCGFHTVVTLEECDFLYEKWVKYNNRESFFKRIKYVIGESFQIQAETWSKYLAIHFLT